MMTRTFEPARHSGPDPLVQERFDGADGFAVNAGSNTGNSALFNTTSSNNVTATEGAASLDALADYLRVGYWEDTSFSESARRFDTSTSNVITVDIGSLTADGKQLARWAFEAWEAVIDVEFREVFFAADIVFDDDDEGAYAETDLGFGPFINSSFVNVSQSDWIDAYGASIDSYSFSTYMHEIGHAIGLGHLGDYNGNGTDFSDATFANDSWQVSIMSYFAQTENANIDASYADPITPMAADILAAQEIYGAAGAGSATDGDTTWGDNHNLTGYMGAYMDDITGGLSSGIYEGYPVAWTIFDAGGTDTIDWSGSSRNTNLIDLRPEHFSNVTGLTGNMAIARGTIIENVFGGSGRDTLIGNDADNEIRGNSGNDSLTGQLGDDTILGGFGVDDISGNGGADSLRGGDGADLLRGGTGQDQILGDAGNDSIRGQRDADMLTGGAGHDNIKGGGGNDTLVGEDGNDFLKGGTRKDTVFGGNGNDRLIGNAFDDLLDGGAGDDTLISGGENDTLVGGAGADKMRGGAGADTFVFDTDDGADTIEDFDPAEDILQLSQALTGTAEAQTIANAAQVTSAGLVLDFASTRITLEGLSSADGLAEAIDIL